MHWTRTVDLSLHRTMRYLSGYRSLLHPGAVIVECVYTGCLKNPFTLFFKGIFNTKCYSNLKQVL